MSFPTPYRADIVKTPGRVQWKGAGASTVSIFSKLGTAIERTIVHELFTVGVDAYGELDQRTREYYATVRMTPDGRFTDATTGDIAALLWPYNNYTPGAVIFPAAVGGGTNYPLEIDGNDGSQEIFGSAALVTMPNLKFTATETAVGQAEWLCLRTDGAQWSGTTSLVTQNNSSGTVLDTTFNPQLILTGPYYASWGAVNTLTTNPFDTLDGFSVEFTIQFSDDTRQTIGLTNRRIKSVGARVRCSPIGSTRQAILAAQYGQGTGAVRGRSLQNGSADFIIKDQNDQTFFTLKNAMLTEDKQNWSSDMVRETDLVWIATRQVTSGVFQPLFNVSVPSGS